MHIAAVSAHFITATPATIWSFVRVACTDGTVGWGEATINGEANAILAEVGRQAAALQGRSADPALSLPPVSPGLLGWAVVSAIDQALWDAAARREGLGLAALLARSFRPGSTPAARVGQYANINRGVVDRAPASFAAAAAGAAQAGFTDVKIAPFDGVTPTTCATPEGAARVRAGLDRIAAAHAALAGQARLMVDCHWRFSPPVAEAVLHEVARIGVVWYECPLPETDETRADITRLRGLANAAGMRLAGMEMGSRLEAFLPWVDAYDVLMPDVKYAGGLAETLRMAEVLASRGAGVSLHNPTGPVCHAASLHVSAVLDNGLPLELQWGETDLLFDLPEPGLPRPQAGATPLPAGPGHGAALPLAAVTPAPEAIVLRKAGAAG